MSEHVKRNTSCLDNMAYFFPDLVAHTYGLWLVSWFMENMFFSVIFVTMNSSETTLASKLGCR